MKHTKEEIINALKVIKDECRDNPTCSTCPFWIPDSDKGCKILDDVETWELNVPDTGVWRAFKS